MLQYLKDRKDTQIAFFSGGPYERNIALVPILLQNAFPNDHERILAESPIFSGHHLSGSCGTRKNLQLVSGHFKAAMKTPICLDNMILIDDRPHVVGEGQNVLSVLPSPVLAMIQVKKRIFWHNRIFYTTGVLDSLFASSSSMTTAEFLSGHYSIYFSRKVEMKEIEPFVLRGLEILQGYNPFLKLVE
jgi:hypothetical protein